MSYPGMYCTIFLMFLLCAGGCHGDTPAVMGTPGVEPRADHAPGEVPVIEKPAYLLYLPPKLDPGRRHPLLVALHPGADARCMINLWRKNADRYGWVLFASKEYRNGPDMYAMLSKIVQCLKRDILVNHPVDARAIMATGLSGGGMGSHALSFWFPDLVSAIIVNTGKMNDIFLQYMDRYPEGKRAVFLASPTDFRYAEMKRDCENLKKRRWKTKWIEFQGGHVFAPPECYDEAARWLHESLPAREQR